MTVLLPDEAYRRLARERLHLCPEPVKPVTPDEVARDAIRRTIALLDQELNAARKEAR